MNEAPNKLPDALLTQASRAVLAGTLDLIEREDTSALIALLIACGAVPAKCEAGMRAAMPAGRS